jgi:hypothetical protein
MGHSTGETRNDVLVVDPSDLRAAMQMEAVKDYDPSATTNRPRFFTNVVLQLARWAQARDPQGPFLKIPYLTWYWTYLDVFELKQKDAPPNLRRVYRYKQDALIDYNPDTVIKSAGERLPDLALSVQVFWPKTAGGLDRYSFEDTTATPRLKVTNHRLLQYRLLDFGDMVVVDDMEGLTGRPTTGVLAALFRIIGEGRVVWSRMAVADNGILVVRARAKKGIFTKTETVRVYPDGTAMRGIPDELEELRELEDSLKQDLEIDYQEWRIPDLPPDETAGDTD